MDPGLNSLLQWGIQNSGNNHPEGPGTQPTESRGLSADALRALMGGPSEADLMKQSMAIICATDTTLESKLIAFDNFEQLIENLDNANNMEPLGLWTPLIQQLGSSEPDLRRMAAWCAGTAVQNNVKAQERLLAVNGVSKLCKLAVEDQDKAVRRKAIYALSSEVRNYQPGMNEAIKFLPKEVVGAAEVSSTDMDTIDTIMTKLRNS